MSKKSPEAVKLGRRGGKATAAKHGSEFYSKLGKKGAKGRLEKYGPNFYSRIRRGEKPSAS